MAVRPEVVQKLTRRTKANAGLDELLQSGEAVDTSYGNDQRPRSIGYIDEETGSDGVRIFIKDPNDENDEDPKYIVVLTVDEAEADSLETDSAQEAITQYREWRTRWPENARAAKAPVRSARRVDCLTFHWCGHGASAAEGGGVECALSYEAAEACAKERGFDLTDERRTVLLALADLWDSGNLDDYSMTGFLGPVLHDAGFRDIDVEPVGMELGWMTMTYQDPDIGEAIELDVERYGQDDPNREVVEKAIKEQIENASPAQIDEYVKVLDDLLEIAPDAVVSTLSRGVPQAVKERTTGRWK